MKHFLQICLTGFLLVGESFGEISDEKDLREREARLRQRPTGKNYFYSRDVPTDLMVISMTGVSSDSAGNPINGDLGTITQI